MRWFITGGSWSRISDHAAFRLRSCGMTQLTEGNDVRLLTGGGYSRASEAAIDLAREEI